MTNQIMKIHSKTCRFVASNAKKRCDCGMGAESNPEITPLMLAAGQEAYLAWDKSDDYSIENLVASVFQAMVAARPVGDNRHPERKA